MLCNISFCISRAGVAITGVLVAMRVLLDQVKTERAVNVFQAVKVLRIQRPAMVQTMVSSVTILLCEQSYFKIVCDSLCLCVKSL